MVKGETKSAVVFQINGEKHTVDGSKVHAKTALVDYIRDVANLKGTKVMCREGGCGACTVSARVIDPASGSEVIKSVNACLTPVLSCDGWDISTIERLGNKHEGYHKIQNRIVNFHGTQCGYCTPGMVMNMYSLYESNPKVGVKDVEQNLDGNICRCTGYRPILEACKSLAQDAPPELQQKCADIEDCTTCPLKQSNGTCHGKAAVATSTVVQLDSGTQWITATTLEEAFSAAANGGSNGTVRFVAGNTSTGIFKNEPLYDKYIDISGIADLKKTVVDNKGITIGGATTLTELINLLKESANAQFLKIATHLERVANVSVRNNGTVAGNLMIKNKHHEFPSDVFVILEAIGAKITLVTSKAKKGLIGCETGKIIVEELSPISVLDFLKTEMSNKIIKSIHLPNLEGYHYRSFKITRRYQNAHAYVNAAFVIKVNKQKGFTVEGKPRLVYGGISAAFNHATETEAALEGKSLIEEKTLKSALATLEKEVKPEEGPLESAPEYRIRLAKSLLYKTILEIVEEKVAKKSKSGASDIVRNVSSSKQFVDKEEGVTALYKKVPKYEGGIQASGEAEYTGDIPFRPDELHAAFVKSTVACANLKDIDASEALKIPGVFRFISAKDVPGLNDVMKIHFYPNTTEEPIFAYDKISYHGQSLGLILATSRDTALRAAKLVKVKYDNIQKPVISLDDAIDKAKADGVYPMQTFGCHKTKPSDDRKVVHTLKGTLRCGAQYHFYMENISTVCHPREDGIDLYCTTQWVDHVQNLVSLALGIPTNSINMQVRRLGGGFGGKVSRPTFIATACAVACWATKRPVRIVLDLETNMSLLGKRLPYYIPYEVGFDDDGRIGSLKIDFCHDSGWTLNEPSVFGAISHVQNVYKAVGWEIDSHMVKTNTPSNTANRAPGSPKAIAAIEWIMDHVANFLKKDPLEVRSANWLESGDALVFGAPTWEGKNLIPEMIETMKKTADYEARKNFVAQFNKENRWKKRGLSVLPCRYGIGYFSTYYPISIAVYHMDGTVAISHGGIEMGQGLNTKVIQTVAQSLGIPVDRIKIKPTSNFTAANAFPSGGSIASEMVCYSATRACEIIRENLKPVLEKLENPSWEKLIAEAYNAKVTLTASYTPNANDDLKGYDVWLLNLVEVEIDVLTGEYKIVRTDLYEDTGKSLSPGIDLGQIEGGYIHGQGYWTTEKIIHDDNTGELLTKGTWDYKVPESRDIPEQFNITLLSNAPNPYGVLRSKATGEPSVDAAFAVVMAMRNAIASAREDAGNSEWFDIAGPVTPEDIAKLCLTKDDHLSL